jgi:hypothetical protein
MPNTQQLRMEDMSEAYLRALCAANGYTIDKREHDNDGVDIGLVCSDKVADDSILESTELKIQLKSSYANITEHEDGSITYKLEVKNYKSLISTKRMIPLILVVFHMPCEEAQWIEQTTDWLKIKKCAYWISLKGKPDTDNTDKISIRIPAENLLTKDSLKEIMCKASKMEDL